MRIEITVLDTGQGRSEASSARATHVVDINAENLSTPERLFDALAAALDFPEYFGRNWGALYECFSDYFIIEDGGLGSEFGGRAGIDADAVKIGFIHADGMVGNGSSMAADVIDLLRYTREANANRAAADLCVEFVVDDPVKRAAIDAILAS